MIPDKPPVQIPEREKLKILGTATEQLTVIEECNKLKLSGFEEHARNLKAERELVGVGDSYANIQPQSMLKIDNSLVGKQLDICVEYTLIEGSTELRWSQGNVILASNGSHIIKLGSRTACYKKGEAVMICWDANPDRNEESTTSAQRIMTSKWNPKGCHMEGAWRIDITKDGRHI